MQWDGLQEVFILIGIPGSLKSSYAKKKTGKDPNVIIINQDTLRSMFRGVYVYDRMTEPLVKDAAGAALVLALKKGHDVIWDDANVTKDERKGWVDLIRSTKTPGRVNITFVEFEPHENCLIRRLQDCRGLPESLWKKLHKQMMEDFEPVQEDEGYDRLIRIPEFKEKNVTLIDFGYSNGWNGVVPKVVENCIKQGHKSESRNIGNCLSETRCTVCGYFYKTDTSG